MAGQRPTTPHDEPRDRRRTTLAIDRDAEVPLGVQLAWALRTRIGDGEFEPGQRLPGLRELADAVGVNLNTVRTVYQRLEQEGLIESQQGSGTFVAPAPATGAAVGSIAATAARSARETGADPRAVAAALYVAPEPPAPSGEQAAELSQAGRRRALREQIATLERTVVELEAENPGIAPAPARSHRGFGPTLLTAEELAQVRAALIRRLTVVQTAIDEHTELRRASPTGATRRASRPERTKAKAKVKAATKPAVPKPASSKPARAPRATPRPAPASG
jgi:DNA-binding transcriptional regulator YhcF (GntR family)